MFWTVPRMWEGETAVIVATGPSITPEQVDYCRGKARVVTINTSYQLAPWADMMYFADQRWFEAHAEGVKKFKGLKVTIQNAHPVVNDDPTIKVLRNDDHGSRSKDGLCEKPDGIKTGRNSGYQAMNVCFHLGVKRIVLLGFDMKEQPGKRWWFGEYGWNSSGPQIYQNNFLPRYKTLVEPFKRHGIEVINATPDSAMDCWPKLALEEALNDTLRNRPGLHSRCRTDTGANTPVAG